MSPPTLKHSLPRQWFLDDPQGIAAALVRVLDARLATIYARANGFRDIWNVLACEPALLKFLARDRGWSLAANLSEASQRKIVDLLVPLYRQKGTLPGMVNIVRLFLGIEPRVRALYAGAWRLNRSRLGGYRTRYTAAGGETEIDLAAVSPAWSSVPYAGELRVWRNGTELAATEFHTLSPTRVLVRTQGVLVVGLRTIPIASLFGFTPNNGEVVVTKNGLALAAGQWSEAPTEITVNVTVAANDVVIVRRLSSPTPLDAGDVIDLTTRDVLTTRLAPSVAYNGLGVLAGSLDAGFTIRVEVPRALTADERAALTALLGVMAPSKARVEIVESRPGLRWILNTTRLGQSAL